MEYKPVKAEHVPLIYKHIDLRCFNSNSKILKEFSISCPLKAGDIPIVKRRKESNNDQYLKQAIS